MTTTTDHNIVEVALALALEAHSGQKDASGEAAILHPLAVGLMASTDEERCAGILLGALGANGISAATLASRGIPAGVVTALELLSRQNAMSQEAFVASIISSHHPIALNVLANDLHYRLAHTPLDGPCSAQLQAALASVEQAQATRNRVEAYDLASAEARGMSVAVFAAGCFWGVQHYFERLDGVATTLVGYCGGSEQRPSYDDVRSHRTGHLECVLVEYDAAKVSYEDLAKLFFEIHDPGQTDGQGPDKGHQYLSGAFYRDAHQQQTLVHLADVLRKKGHEVNTIIAPLGCFWIAEEWHQHYYDHTGGSPYCHFRVRKF